MRDYRSSKRAIIDTADRLRVTDQIEVDGRWLLVEEIADDSTQAHPSRLKLALVDPNGRTFHDDDLTHRHIYAGETVTFRPGSTHLADATGQRPGRVI
jgi:hypothetical protein